MLDAPIYLKLKPSRRLRRAVILGHAGVLVLLGCGAPLHAASAAVTVAVIASLAASLMRLSRRRRDTIEALLFGSDRRWTLRTRDRAAVSAQLLAGSLVTPHLTVLRFSLDDGHRLTAFLLPDNVPAEPFRRLRARLRLREAPSGTVPVNR